VATGTIELYPGGEAPDGSGTGNNPMRVAQEVSSTTQTTDSPKLTQTVHLAGDSTPESLIFRTRIPSDYASGGTLKVLFKNKAVQTGGVAKKVRWNASQKSRGPGDVDDPAGTSTAFETVTGQSVTLDVDQADETVKEASIDLTTTGMGAGDKVVIFIGRAPGHADDDAVGDMALLVADLEYTTT
jgi:hypothetical protein